MVLPDHASGPEGSSYRDPETEILHKCYYRILIQVVQKDPAAEILYKWSYRILKQVVQKDPHIDFAQVVLQDPETEIFRKCS